MAPAAGAYAQSKTLEHYFSQIKNHELLTKEEEIQLIRRYQEADDYTAVDRLVQANLRLVVKIAREYYSNPACFSLNDLIQQGNLGLVHAVHKFDPGKKTKFSYYATFWIKAHIFKYIMDNYSSIRIGKTQAQRKLFFNLRKTKEKLRRNGLPATPEQIARWVGVKPVEVEQMEKRMEQRDQSLNAPCRVRTDEQMLDNLKTDGESADEMVASRQMGEMLGKIISKFKTHLNRREREILERRIVAHDPLTLQKLGERFNVSRERIRQVEANIIRKLRVFFQAEIPDFEHYLAG